MLFLGHSNQLSSLPLHTHTPLFFLKSPNSEQQQSSSSSPSPHLFLCSLNSSPVCPVPHPAEETVASDPHSSGRSENKQTIHTQGKSCQELSRRETIVCPLLCRVLSASWVTTWERWQLGSVLGKLSRSTVQSQGCLGGIPVIRRLQVFHDGNGARAFH